MLRASLSTRHVLENDDGNPQISWNSGVPCGVLNNQSFIVKENGLDG